MFILIVSANSLLKEVINEIITQLQAETLELSVEEAISKMCEIRPDVIVIDATITAPYLESLLAEARNLEKTRTIVLHPIQNEIVLLDSRRVTLKKAEDLIDSFAI